PVVTEQVREEVVAPFRGRRGPRHLEAARDRVGPFAGTEAALPAEAEVFDPRSFGLRSDVLRVTGAMRLAERMAARNQRDRFLVVQGQGGRGLAKVARARGGIGVPFRAFRVQVDQPHLSRRERNLEVAIARVTLVLEPLAFGAPVDVPLGLPNVLPTPAE